jgi:uncharacterized protein YukE
MDIEKGQNLVKELARASERFARLSSELTPVVNSSIWNGADSQQFKADWKYHSRTLMSVSQALRDASNSVQENVRQQQETSRDGNSGGGGSKSLLDRLKENAGAAAGELWDDLGDLWDGAGDTVDTVGDRIKDGWDIFTKMPITDAAGDVSDRLGNIARLGWDFLKTGEPPSVSELVAGHIELFAAVLNLSVTSNSFGLYNPHLLDDGSATAGEPIAVDVGPVTKEGASHNSTPVPSSLSNIMLGVSAAYGDVGKEGTPDAAIRIVTVDSPEGPAYIVMIPGTSEWNVQSGSNPMDTVGNLATASGDLSTASEAVILAMQKAGIPPGAPVFMVGHSQGGMTAAELAANAEFRAQFNVTTLLTYGSAIDSTRIPDSVHTLALQHPNDLVPRLDLGNAKPWPGGLPILWESSNNAAVVTLPDLPDVGFTDVVANHDYITYAKSVAANENSGAIAAFKNDPSTQAFLTDDPSQVTSTVSNLGREQ